MTKRKKNFKKNHYGPPRRGVSIIVNPAKGYFPEDWYSKLSTLLRLCLGFKLATPVVDNRVIHPTKQFVPVELDEINTTWFFTCQWFFSMIDTVRCDNIELLHGIFRIRCIISRRGEGYGIFLSYASTDAEKLTV